MTDQTIGRFVVESKLGEGGMGIVYKARDTQLARTVALKVLPPDRSIDADRKRRFLQEARAASALNHPNIVSIYDVVSDGDADFIVMEYVAGATLDHRIPAQGLPVNQAVGFAIEIAGALAKAHEAGIIHRDLKPSNVMIADDGVVKILDFGVAKLMAPEASGDAMTAAATEPGIVVGTPAYMSPEQADGRPVDARSDIFSFGSVLYEMVTGRQAFSGPSRLWVLTRVVNEEPAAPGRLTPDVQPELEKLILRCLRKDPGRRYQTMPDVKVALEDLAEDSSRTTEPQPSKRSSLSRWRWAVAALVPVLLVAGYIASQLARTPGSLEPMQAVPLTSLSGQLHFPALSPDGNHVAFTWNGPKGDNEDVWVQQIGAGSPLRLTTNPGNDSSPAWSPDGRAIAFVRRQSNFTTFEVRVVPPLGGTERVIAEITPRNPVFRALTVEWCPDSSCVIVPDGQGEGKPDALFVIGRDGADRRQLTFPPPGTIIDSDPAIAPDGRSLVFRRDLLPNGGEIYRLALTANLTPAGEPARLTNTKGASRPAWLPDSREIVFSARDGLWRLDAFSGGAPTRLPFVGLDGYEPAISRMLTDGRVRLVYVRIFGDSNVWRIDTTAAGLPASSPPQRAVASTRQDGMPALSPDGNRLAFVSNRSGESQLWVGDPDGSNAVQLTSLKSNSLRPRWSPDGKTLAFQSNLEDYVDAFTIPAKGGQPRSLVSGPLGGAFPSFSRDGRWIYLTGRNAKGDRRLVRMPASGGTAEELTATAAYVPIESYDGRDLYYLEAVQRPSALWRLPLTGGAPSKVLDGVVNASFDVVERGIYYIDREAGGDFSRETRLQYFDFATRRTTTVARSLGILLAGLSASRDGRTILIARVDSSTDELILVENFR